MNIVEEILSIEQKQNHESNESDIRVLQFRKSQAIKNYFIKLRGPMKTLSGAFSNSRNDVYFESGDRESAMKDILTDLDKAINTCKEGIEFKKSPVYKHLGKLMEVTARFLERFRDRLTAKEGSWRRINSREKAEKKFKGILRFLAKRLNKLSEVLSTPHGSIVR